LRCRLQLEEGGVDKIAGCRAESFLQANPPNFTLTVGRIAGHETLDQSERAAAYAAGLERWRVADFTGAEVSFTRFADCDPPSAMFLERARNYSAHPPGPDWEPVNRLTEK
jgi:hypothetical protein